MTVIYKLLGIPKGESNFIQIDKTRYKSVFEDGHKEVVKELIKPHSKQFPNYDYVFLFVAFDDVDNFRYITIQLYPKPHKRFSINDIMEKIKEKFSQRIH